jgi:serine/threonine protein kinase
VSREGEVKLIDFGLSIPNTRDFRKPGNRTGTPDFLAPELIKRLTTDHRVDLFALGVTAYVTFTNAMPWDRADSMQTLLNHVNVQPRDPRDIKPELPKPVVDFLLKSIQRDPTARFQTAVEMKVALDALPRL